MTELVVTGHQLNFLPGISVMSKIAAADVVIWMDEMQYERHGFVNRNRLADGAWLTVPVADADTFQPIREVTIADPTGRAREKIARTFEMRLGKQGARYAEVMRRPFARLAALNLALLWRLCHDLGITADWTLQSHLAAASYGDTSEGIAAMVAEVGGTVWLSGQSGRNYLDEAPFRARGIEVRYWQHDGPNPCALELLREGREHTIASHRSAA